MQALRFWSEGNERAAADAEIHFAEAERLTIAAGTPDTWLIVNSAREIFAESTKVSTWRTFRRHVDHWSPLWRRYLRALAAQPQPVVELWPSQRLALEAGLLDEGRPALVVRTPTSSGKTRMAEAAILDAINRDPGVACCVYIVPFRALAAEVEAVLRSPALGDFLHQMYGNGPTRWDDALTGVARLRVVVNALTRLRFCTPDGQMEFDTKEGAGAAPAGYLPWFEAPNRQTANVTVAFGHWSTLGQLRRPDLLALDSGCVWGGALSAMRIDEAGPQARHRLVQVQCEQAQRPGR